MENIERAMASEKTTDLDTYRKDLQEGWEYLEYISKDDPEKRKEDIKETKERIERLQKTIKMMEEKGLENDPQYLDIRDPKTF